MQHTKVMQGCTQHGKAHTGDASEPEYRDLSAWQPDRAGEEFKFSEVKIEFQVLSRDNCDSEPGRFMPRPGQSTGSLAAH